MRAVWGQGFSRYLPSAPRSWSPCWHQFAAAQAYEAPTTAFAGANAFRQRRPDPDLVVHRRNRPVGRRHDDGQQGLPGDLRSTSRPSPAAPRRSRSSPTVSGCATSGTCSGLGTLTVTFSRPVLDPVIHFGGLGGNNTGPGNRSTTFHGTLTLTTPGLTLTKVGTGTNYQVTGGSKITAVNQPRASTSCTTVGTPARRWPPVARLTSTASSPPPPLRWAPSPR